MKLFHNIKLLINKKTKKKQKKLINSQIQLTIITANTIAD